MSNLTVSSAVDAFMQSTTTLALGGVTTQSGAKIIAPSAMGAYAIDGGSMVNTLTLSGDHTLTVSGSPATNTYFGLYLTSSSASVLTVTLTGGTPATFKLGAGLSQYYVFKTTGAGAYLLVNGAPSVLDLPADATPATTKLIPTTNATTGVESQSTIAQILANVSAAAAGIPYGTAQTSNYTLALTDANGTVPMNLAGANTVTVPPHGTIALPVGTVVYVKQIGAGATSIVAGAGVTVNQLSNTLTLPGQYGYGFLYQTVQDTWDFAININLAVPGAIGGTTPAAGAFTTLAASGIITSTLGTGTAPFTVASTTQVANLSAATAGNVTGTVAVANGGTGATTAVGAIAGLTPASVNLGNCTGTISLNWALGNVFYGVLTGATTFTFTGAVDGQTIVVRVAQTGTNTYTVAWPSAKWHSGTAPTMTISTATSDLTTFVNYGGTYYGNSVQDMH